MLIVVWRGHGYQPDNSYSGVGSLWEITQRNLPSSALLIYLYFTQLTSKACLLSYYLSLFSKHSSVFFNFYLSSLFRSFNRIGLMKKSPLEYSQYLSGYEVVYSSKLTTIKAFVIYSMRLNFGSVRNQTAAGADSPSMFINTHFLV